VLTIRGEKKSEREEKKDQARYVERRYGTFSRSFSLPSNASEDKLEASFGDGVLTIRIRKKEEAKPRVINIKSG
jgi:HSP20 family protein